MVTMKLVRQPSLGQAVAEEIRVLLARKRLSAVKLGEMIKRSQTYVSRRLNGDVAFDLNDLEQIAQALEVQFVDLLPTSVRDGGDGPTRRYGPAVDPLAPRLVATIGATTPKGPGPGAFTTPGRPTPQRPGTRVTRPAPRPLTPTAR